jgi:hypothetical protein
VEGRGGEVEEEGEEEEKEEEGTGTEDSVEGVRWERWSA